MCKEKKEESERRESQLPLPGHFAQYSISRSTTISAGVTCTGPVLLPSELVQRMQHAATANLPSNLSSRDTVSRPHLGREHQFLLTRVGRIGHFEVLIDLAMVPPREESLEHPACSGGTTEDGSGWR